MAKEKEIGGMNMEEVRNSQGKLVCRVDKLNKPSR